MPHSLNLKLLSNLLEGCSMIRIGIAKIYHKVIEYNGQREKIPRFTNKACSIKCSKELRMVTTCTCSNLKQYWTKINSGYCLIAREWFALRWQMQGLLG